jgi:hypothetical protein
MKKEDIAILSFSFSFSVLVGALPVFGAFLRFGNRSSNREAPGLVVLRGLPILSDLLTPHQTNDDTCV